MATTMATVQLLISDAYDQHDDNATAQSQIEVHIMLMFRYQRLSLKLVLIIPRRFLFLLEGSTAIRLVSTHGTIFRTFGT